MSKRVAHNKLTQERVIEQFKEVHGDEFDYSRVVYVDTHTPIEVRCKKHDFIFHPTPKNHKNGAKCTICGRESQIQKARKEQDKFIEDVKDLYGDEFGTDLIDYTNNKSHIKIQCKHHGIFEVRPDIFLRGGGCTKCSKKKTKSSNKETFITEAIKVYGDKDDYTNTNIISSKHNIDIRCKKHDITFNKNIQTYLGGWGCPECSAENYRELRAIPLEEYYIRVNEKHDNKYTYNNDFTILKNAVTFFCSEHGKQKRNAQSHLIGAGCKHCDTEPHKTTRITKRGYCKLANDRPTTLYIIECYKGNDRFYKIGKTFRKLEERFSTATMPYKFKTIHTYIDTAENIWDLEEELHKKYKEFSQRPKIWFSGYTECYNLDLPIQEIINL